MPQGPIFVRDVADATGYVANLTATTGNVVKTTNARVIKVAVVASSTGVGGIWDAAAIANTAASNKIFTVPATVGVYTLEWPCTAGVIATPAAGMTLAITLG